MEYEIGRFYRVRCVWGRVHSKSQWWPLLSDVHEDREIIGFPYDHAHIDARFIDKRTWAWLDYGTGAQHDIFAVPFQIGNGLNDTFALEFKERRLKCHREMPAYPVVPIWQPKLESAFRDIKVVDNRCPHRGVDLSTCKKHGDLVQCPGHGLWWNVRTGQLCETAS